MRDLRDGRLRIAAERGDRNYRARVAEGTEAQSCAACIKM